MTEPIFEIGKQSDTGPARERNEDYVDFVVPQDEELHREKGALFVVADGMGGHKAGQVASRESVEQVVAAYYADPGRDVGECLERAIKAANQAIHDQAQAEADMAGMGTTLVAAVIRKRGRQVIIANVGDSRAYVLHRQKLKQITIDHSWVEAQFRAGLLTREQTKTHPQRNLITRAVGIQPTVEVDLFRTSLRRKDALLLCSDGVSGELSDKQMAQVMGSRQPEDAAAELVDQANALGGTDNATALIVRAETQGGTLGHKLGSTASARLEWNRTRTLSLLALLLLLLVAGVLLAALLTNQ